MANINFTGFVEKELTNSRGEQFGFTIAEPHRKKQDDGSYKTTARTFHTVKGAATVGHRKGDRVTVNGRQVTEPWDRDGETRYSLMVWADTVEAARSGTSPVPGNPEHVVPGNTESGDPRNTADYGTPPEDPWANTHQWETTPIPEDTPF